MGVQWTLIATFLYAEIAAVLILLIPFIKPNSWQKIFKSRFLKGLEKQSFIYFSVFIIILLIFFINAIRDVRKFTQELEDHKAGAHAHVIFEMQIRIKLFRTERNIYISGFALFLCLLLRRMVSLVSCQAGLVAESSAGLQQARNSSEMANKLMEEQQKRQASEEESADNVGNIAKESYEKEIQQLKTKLKESQEELNHSRKDLDVIKKQSQSRSKEYNGLLKEYDSLRRKLEVSQGIHHDKKEE